MKELTRTNVPAFWRGNPLRYTWSYLDPEGNVLGYVARYDRSDGEKEVIPFFLQSNGAWASGAPAAPRPLFGLDTLSFPQSTVFVVEGEKCAAALHSLGLPAVTNLGSTGGVLKTDWTPLERFEEVVFLPDNDASGGSYVATVAEQLGGLKGSRKVSAVYLPDLLHKGDVVDWIRAWMNQADSEIEWDGFQPVPEMWTDQVRDAFLTVVSEEAKPLGSDWQDDPAARPIALPSNLRTGGEPFPLESLGKTLEGAARAMREIIQAPEAMCGQSVLAAASCVVHAYADMEIDGRVSPLSLFCLTVGESGERKSAVDTQAVGPIREFHRELHTIYQDEKLAFRNESEVYEKARLAILGKGNMTLAEKKSALESLGPPPEAPLIPVLLSDDVTYEGVVKVLENGWPSLGLFADEGGKLVGGHAMNPDNILKSAAGLSSFWDGKDVSRLRSGDGVTLLRGRRVAIHWMLQPTVADMLFGSDILTGQGFLSRCLPAWPESTAGTRLYKENDLSQDPRILQYNRTMLSILRRPIVLIEGTRNALSPRRLTLEPIGKLAWIEFHDHVERALVGSLAEVKGFANKAAEHAARIAGVLAMLDNFDTVTVSLDHVNRGISLAQYYLSEVLRIREAGMARPELLHAKRVLDWMTDNPEKATGHDGSFALRTIIQYGPPPRSKEDMEQALQILAEHGFVSQSWGQGSQKPLGWRLAV